MRMKDSGETNDSADQETGAFTFFIAGMPFQFLTPRNLGANHSVWGTFDAYATLGRTLFQSNSPGLATLVKLRNVLSVKVSL